MVGWLVGFCIDFLLSLGHHHQGCRISIDADHGDPERFRLPGRRSFVSFSSSLFLPQAFNPFSRRKKASYLSLSFSLSTPICFSLHTFFSSQLFRLFIRLLSSRSHVVFQSYWYIPSLALSLCQSVTHRYTHTDTHSPSLPRSHFPSSPSPKTKARAFILVRSLVGCFIHPSG